jgi:hypothetical protein
MDAFIVNKNSFSYRLNKALFWNIFDYHENSISGILKEYPKDFCGYWRHFMYSLIIASALLFVVGVVGKFLIQLLIILFQNPSATGTGILIAVGGIICLLAAVYVILEWIVPYIVIPILDFIWKYLLGPILRPVGKVLGKIFVAIIDVVLYLWEFVPKRSVLDKPAKKKKEKSPSVFWLKYKALKDQYCPMVEYTEKT